MTDICTEQLAVFMLEAFQTHNLEGYVDGDHISDVVVDGHFDFNAIAHSVLFRVRNPPENS